MRFELYRGRRGLLMRTQWRWRLIAKNGRIIATSGESYSNKGDALDMIAKIQGEVAIADVRIID